MSVDDNNVALLVRQKTEPNLTTYDYASFRGEQRDLELIFPPSGTWFIGVLQTDPHEAESVQFTLTYTSHGTHFAFLTSA